MRYEQADDKSTGELSARELTSRLGEQLSALARAEIALAKAELFARGRQAVTGGGLFAAAGVAGLGGYLALIAAAIAGIAVALPVWAGALIVGAALMALAGGLALIGRRRVARGVPPLPVTTGTVRRDLAELTGRNGRAGSVGRADRNGRADSIGSAGQDGGGS